MNFKDIIKELRSEKNKTQQEVSADLLIPRYILSNWEQGRNEPSISELIKIANYFDVSIDFLSGREDALQNLDPRAIFPAEWDMLKKFRALDPRHQEVIRMQIETLLELDLEKTK